MRRKLRWMTGVGLACVGLLAGCGEMKLKVWPFGGDTAQERSRTPANATEYQCTGGKRFHVRTLESGGAVWLILSERELRLDRLGPDSATRYSKGGTVLEINGNEATLTDGAVKSFIDCKTAKSGQEIAPQ